MSPCLWLAFFNRISKDLSRMREGEGLVGVTYKDLIFADVITLLITADSQQDLQKAAELNVGYLRKILANMLLKLATHKCQNIVFNPMLMPLGIFRRTDNVRYPTTVNRLRKQHRAEAGFLTTPIDFDPFEEEAGIENVGIEYRNYPFPKKETVKILGVTIDSQFTLDEHFTNIVTKAAVRQCLLTKVSNSHWGLEVGTLHITHNAVINSLLRYALTVTGSVFPPDLVRKLNTQIINAAARKIGGVSRTARIESLHFVMNTATFLNLYVPHCAVFLDGCVRAHTSGICKRLLAELAVYYNTTDFETQGINVVLPINKIRNRF